MAVNKVVYGNQTLIDLTDSTLVTDDQILSGTSAYNRSGILLQGSATIGNGTLTIQRNSTTVGIFTANQSGNTTANISVPTNADEIEYSGGSQGDITEQARDVEQAILALDSATQGKQNTLTAGNGIAINNNVINNTAPIYFDSMGAYSSATPINADLLDGTAKEDLSWNTELLWTNASPTTDIPESTDTTFRSKGYTRFLLRFYTKTNNTITVYFFAELGVRTYPTSISDGMLIQRPIIIYENSIKYEVGAKYSTYKAVSTDNQYMILYQVYGIK